MTLKVKNIYFQKRICDESGVDVYYNGQHVDTIPASAATKTAYARYGVKPFKGLTFAGIFPSYRGEYSDECRITVEDPNGYMQIKKPIIYKTRMAPSNIKLIVRNRKKENYYKNSHKIRVNCFMPAFEYTIEGGRIAILKDNDLTTLKIELPYQYVVNNFSKNSPKSIINFIKKLLLI